MLNLKDRFLISLGIFLIALVIYFSIDTIYGWGNSKGLNLNEYCETTKINQILAQPINSLSNFGFFFIGVSIIYKNQNHKLTLPKVYVILAGITCIMVGFTSFLFHAEYTTLTKQLDSAFTYIGAMILMILAAQVRTLKSSVKIPEWYREVVVILTIIAMIVFFTLNINAMYFVLITIALGILIVLWELHHGIKFDNKYIFLGLGTFFISFLIRYVDVEKIYCDPSSLFQLHAIWHLGSALGYWFLYKFLESAKTGK